MPVVIGVLGSMLKTGFYFKKMGIPDGKRMMQYPKKGVGNLRPQVENLITRN